MTDKQASRSREVLVDDLELESSYVDPAERRASRERTVARLQLFWEHRRFLLKMLAGGVAVSLLLALLIPYQYQSIARLMPPDQSSSLGLAMLAGLTGKSNSNSLANLAGNALGLKSSGDLFLGVLQSRTIRDDIVDKFNLRKVYREQRWESARDKLASRTDLSTDRTSGIILIKVSDRSPQRAAAMAQEYITQLNQVLATQDTSAAHRERVFLEQRLQQVKQNLEVAEKEFSDFASKNAALDVPTQGKAMVAATASLQGELIAAQTELQGLRQIYTDSNVRVRSTQARIEELQHQLDQMGSGSDNGSGSQTSPSANASFYPSFRKLPALGVTYADLLRNTKVQEAVFEALTQEYELAKVEEAKELPSVKVLDPPNVPEKPSFLPRFLMSLLGGLAVLAVGLGCIVASTNWAHMDPQDPLKQFASRVFTDVSGQVDGVSSNGTGSAPQRIWRRLKKSSASEHEQGPRDSIEKP
jgi:capsule polysaccharide export protein KpsE/RkpR